MSTPPPEGPTYAELWAEFQAQRQLLQQQQTLIAELQEQVRELTARLNQNSANSSRPPSSDPPGVRRPKKAATGRKRGGQPGHPGTTRCAFPPERVAQRVEHFPDACGHCGSVLAAPPDAAGAVTPRCHQVVELPPLRPLVTEHRLHRGACAVCGKHPWATLPVGVSPRVAGPRLPAVIALLSGACRRSRRTVQVLLADLSEGRLSLGTLCAVEADIARALDAPYQEVAAAVARAPTAHVDETGWREGGQRCWIWTATAGKLALFRLDRRNPEACAALLTEAGKHPQVTATVISDRYGAYAHLPLSQRSLCWAHLARDFRGLAESAGASGAVGRWALEVLGKLFREWRRFGRGEVDRRGRAAAVAPLQEQCRTRLRWGEESGCRKGKALCRDLLKHWEALWTWVSQAGVEPTNNAAERALRPAVLWRKSSFGHQSASGKAFVERWLTAVTSLRLQHRDVWSYLEAASRAHLAGSTPPSLLPSP